MSLTRSQWLEMWSYIKKIERLTGYSSNGELRDSIDKIKELIQSVIEQIE